MAFVAVPRYFLDIYMVQEQQFYVVEKPLMSKRPWGTEFFDYSEDIGDQAPVCDSCKRIIGSLPWLPPFSAEIETWYRVYADFIMGNGGDFLISERFKGIVVKEGLIGFTGFESIKVVKVTKHKRFSGDPPPYYRVNVNRNRAAYDTVASDFRWLDPEHPVCLQCRKGGQIRGYSGLVLERGSWTGEDIFEPRGPFHAYMVTERFRSICEAHAITGVLFIPAERHWYDFHPEDNFETCEAIMEMPLSDGVLEKTTRDGNRTRYIASSNECVICRWDGSMSLIHPIGGLSTWHAM